MLAAEVHEEAADAVLTRADVSSEAYTGGGRRSRGGEPQAARGRAGPGRAAGRVRAGPRAAGRRPPQDDDA